MQSSQLELLLKFLTDTLQESKDFTVEQAPQFVQELLRWQLYEAALFAVAWACFGVIVMTLGATWLGSALEDELEAVTTKRIVRFGMSLLMLIAITANVHDIVQVIVAPRVVLVEMVRDLIAGPRR